MKVGISLTIDVTKMDKSAFYQGKKGTYATLKAFVDLDNEDQYGNNGMITQDLGKERQDEKGPILGNSKVFWKDVQNNVQNSVQEYNNVDAEELPF